MKPKMKIFDSMKPNEYGSIETMEQLRSCRTKLEADIDEYGHDLSARVSNIGSVLSWRHLLLAAVRKLRENISPK